VTAQQQTQQQTQGQWSAVAVPTVKVPEIGSAGAYIAILILVMTIAITFGRKRR